MTWSLRSQQLTQLETETGAIRKDWGGRLAVALAFPNTYYVGMSSLALQILYRRFNAHERCGVRARVLGERRRCRPGVRC